MKLTPSIPLSPSLDLFFSKALPWQAPSHLKLTAVIKPVPGLGPGRRVLRDPVDKVGHAWMSYERNVPLARRDGGLQRKAVKHDGVALGVGLRCNFGDAGPVA
jgi:hypothetical protein